jgi:molybdopterin-synthase adenylyltransferase
MIPIVYLNKEQFVQAAVEANGAIRLVAGYEWPREAVFHVHTEPPPYTTVGAPVSCFLKYVDSQEIDNAADVFLAAALSISPNVENPVLGILVHKQEEAFVLEAYYKCDGAVQVCNVCYIPRMEELHSRSKGLLETGVLANKKVLIIGLGSFGSHIAVELAKAGIGTFTLVDFDRIELSNIARHVCGVNELGRLKTHAMRDAILLKNPFAHVNTVEADINSDLELLRNLVLNADIVICVTDNNRSRFNVNMLGVELDKVVLFGRAITRAEGGDVFKLNGKEGPCYCCLVGNDTLAQSLGEEEISSRKQADETLPAYTTEQDRAAAVQVGLSSDIFPICNMLVKLALVELSKNTESGLAGLAEELSYSYYLWANRREKQYANWGAFNQPENKPTILRWYGVKVPKVEGCFGCLSTVNDE